MAISVPPPPRQQASPLEWEQHWEVVTKKLRGQVRLVADAAVTIGSNDTYVGVTALTAPRTLTLPPSADLQDGDLILVQDESGAAGAQTITIARQGSDTVNGGASVTITTNYGRRWIVKRGTGKFFSA